MPFLDNDNMNDKISKSLKDLRKVDAPSNFETELFERIKAGEQKEGKKSWFDKILSPRLIPSAALAATAVIIFLLLRPQVLETEKNLPKGPSLYEEKFDEQIELKPETKKEKIYTNNGQKSDGKSFKITSESREKDYIYPKEASNPNKISDEVQPAVLDKKEVEASPDHSEQKTSVAEGQNLIMLRTKEGELKQIEMLKGKIDTTKDSAKNNQKLKKF
jgi:hypothetical protein